MSHNTVDVLIVGAGPVGLFCANELIRQGLSCRIIDKKSGTSDKSKALGIHIRTLDVLEDCGLIDDVLKQGHKVDGILFQSNGKMLVNATFDGIKSDRHYLIDLAQNQTEHILYQHLQAKKIQVEWDTELTEANQSDTEVTVKVKKINDQSEILTAKWLIACDGAHSSVRHQVHAEFKGSAYKQTWWLADLIVDWQVPENKMAMYISDKGPLACFPMGNRRYRLVMTAPKNKTTTPTLLEVMQEFKQRSTDEATLSNPIWLSEFTIHHRQIQQYRYDRIFFAGDAAHIHSPMGGQGLNTGIQDIYNLAWKLALVQQGKADSNLLDSYHAERYHVGHEVLRKTDLMTRMILLNNPFLVACRNAFIRFITSFKYIRTSMITDLAELSISYAKSPIVHRTGYAHHLKAGTFFPRFFLIEHQTENKTNSHALTQGTLHHFFIFSGLDNKNNTTLIELAHSLVTKYPETTKVHLVLNNENTLPENTQINVLIDKNKEVHNYFRLKEPALILVRPDKYIGIVQHPINEKVLWGQLYFL